MTILSLDTMRLLGMRLLAAMMGAIAILSVGAAWLLGVPGAATAMFISLALPAYPLWLALRGQIDPAARILVTATLVAQPAVMLFIFRGSAWQVDLHMIFFAALAATAVLCDWRALLAGAGVIAVHHLAFGMLVPDWVFLNGGGIGRILLHAIVLVAETVALMVLASRMTALLDALAAGTKQRAAAELVTESERAAHAAQLGSVIATINSSLKTLAEGDLTQGIHSPLPQVYAELEANFGLTVQSLSTLIGSVSQGASEIRNASDEIANASEDLAKRTETAAHSLETTNQAVSRMDARLKAAASSAASVVVRADQALATVRSSRTVADEVVEAMGRVAESAKGIDDVIEGLDKIAFQTRVLAMNAAVEAGRAGEAGRGFAVVADLVSALAMRAEEEAKRARDQLSVTQGEIISAVGAVSKVDGALGSISSDVAEVHQLLDAMAADNQSQAGAIDQISQAMTAMDAATQQNAAMVEETSATARRLTDEIEALVDNTRRFKVAGSAVAGFRPQIARGASVH